MTVKVSVSELPSYYDSCLGLPMLVTGESGIGKTEITKQWTEARSLACVDVRASQLDPSDVKGVPYREGLASRWAIPDFLPQVDRDGEEGVLVLDEYLDGDEAVFSAFQQLILERRLGDYIFPDKWMIIALGNKKEHGGVNRGLSSAQQDRFVHLEASLDHDSLYILIQTWRIKGQSVVLVNGRGQHQGLTKELILFLRKIQTNL